MTKQELRDLAAVGFVAKLKAIEAELGEAFKLFPEVFLGSTPPQLVRPELRNGKGKHWPLAATKKTGRRGFAASPGGHADRKRANRTRSAAILAALEGGVPVTPAQLSERTGGDSVRWMGALVRRGYAKRKGGGYVRTGKVFVVDTRKGAGT